MRDRLIELLEKANETVIGFTIDGDIGIIADHLLAEGVIVPPCKVGDTVYHITGIDTREDLDLTDIFEGKVKSISKDEKALWIYVRYDNGLTYWYEETDIGRRLFLTREEAEKALERSENGT